MIRALLLQIKLKVIESYYVLWALVWDWDLKLIETSGLNKLDSLKLIVNHH